MGKELSKATSVFLDLFKLTPGVANKKLLSQISTSFANLPWENLSKYVKKHGLIETTRAELPEQIRLLAGADVLRLSEEVMTDHADHGTGGTCFSLTNTLQKICTDLGFKALPAMADMRHGANIHCGLIVFLDGERFLLDPGYLVAEPIQLTRGKDSRLGAPGHRIEYRAVPGTDEFELYTVNARGDETYRYRLRPQPVDDLQFLRYWLESFDTNGMNGLHLNALSGEGRLSAHNFNLRLDTGHGKKNIKLKSGYVEKVSSHFGISAELVQRAYDEWERRRCLQ